MATQLFANNAASVLASSITNVATSLTVTTGHGARFPSPTGSDFFLATLCQQGSVGEINFEIVKVTARSTDTFTIVRAQEGTTGLAYNVGDKVELRLTKGTMEKLATATGTLTADTLVVGNGVSDVKVVSDIKAATTDTLIHNTTYGRLGSYLSSWTPNADSPKYFNQLAFYKDGVGFSGGSAANKWASVIGGTMDVAILGPTFTNSHYHHDTRLGYIPNTGGPPAANSANTVPSGGPWATPLMDGGGVPVDANYTEMGGYQAALWCGVEGHYLEGAGITCSDYYPFGGSAVPCPMTSAILNISKNAASNLYRTTGLTIQSMGSQQTTYAPMSAILVAGGWQNGLDLSLGTYNGSAIVFPDGHSITHTPDQLFINASGVSLNVSADGCGLSAGSFVGDLVGDVTGNVAASTVTASTSVLSTGTGGIGYATGAGGEVTQATSKATAVTLNKACGRITMHAAALAAGASIVFLINNSLVTATDLATVNPFWGAVDPNNYRIETLSVNIGAIYVRVTNISAGSLSEALQMKFAVVKAVIT